MMKKTSSTKRSRMTGGREATNFSPPVDKNAPSASPENSSFLSSRRFTNVNVENSLSQATLRAVRDHFGHTHLSKVQAYTFDALMSGTDVFVKSKTGSGKTMAFLLPAVERAYSSSSSSSSSSGRLPSGLARVHSVVVSPTKELAAQTFEEAKKLTAFAPAKTRVALIIGGNDRKSDVRTLSAPGDIAVLVATPGRLQDYVQTLPGFAKEVMANITSIVLDEADRMLDAGFRKPLETILDASPPVGSRQTVLVSATMPADVLSLSRKYMRPDMTVIDVVRAGKRMTGEAALLNAAEAAKKEAEEGGPEGAATAINPDVSHSAIVAPHSVVPHAMLQALCDHAASRPAFKIVVFFPFKRQVQLMGELLRRTFKENDCLGKETELLEIHSDLQQSQRNKASDTFRTASRAVLLGTDVVARGVDYPDVSFVLQMGLTDRETYVHRVGRTGRAGKKGEALIVLAPFEEAPMRKRLDGYGVKWIRANDPEKSGAQNARAQAKQTVRNGLPNADATVQVATRPGLQKAASDLARTQGGMYRRAYSAWLGFYGSEANSIGVSKTQLLKEAAEAYAAIGMTSPPELSPELKKKMGYK